MGDFSVCVWCGIMQQSLYGGDSDLVTGLCALPRACLIIGYLVLVTYTLLTIYPNPHIHTKTARGIRIPDPGGIKTTS